MVSELGCLWSGGLTSFSSTVGPGPARRLCESFFIQTYRQIDRQTDRQTHLQARMLILSCFCNQDIFIIITTPLYGFLPTLAAILAILRASSLSDGERERQREQEEQIHTEEYDDKERARERARDKERERERQRERENTTGTLHQQALKVKYSNHHTHISNNSISCRYNLTWSPMYCTNTIWQTQMLMEMLQQTRPTLAAYNKKRAQPVTTAVNHMTLQNCRYKLTWSTMCWRNKIRQNRDATETSQHTRPRLPAYNNKRV